MYNRSPFTTSTKPQGLFIGLINILLLLSLKIYNNNERKKVEPKEPIIELKKKKKKG